MWLQKVKNLCGCESFMEIGFAIGAFGVLFLYPNLRRINIENSKWYLCQSKNIYGWCRDLCRGTGDNEVAEYYIKLANRNLKEQGKEIPCYMSYLEGDGKEAYVEDVQIIQCYAVPWRRNSICCKWITVNWIK